uniref:Uncharacterized protein n=1 Tax=Anguilla anguilla TaxID=7936 RepID=A0A0E9UJ78_ANGAN
MWQGNKKIKYYRTGAFRNISHTTLNMPFKREYISEA